MLLIFDLYWNWCTGKKVTQLMCWDGLYVIVWVVRRPGAITQVLSFYVSIPICSNPRQTLMLNDKGNEKHKLRDCKGCMKYSITSVVFLKSLTIYFAIIQCNFASRWTTLIQSWWGINCCTPMQTPLLIGSLKPRTNIFKFAHVWINCFRHC